MEFRQHESHAIVLPERRVSGKLNGRMYDGTHREISYQGQHCKLTIEQYPCGVVVIRVSGTDVGEFGDAPMQDLKAWLEDAGAVELFVDARNARGPSIDVSCDWAKWLNAHRVQLQEISMLTGSRFVQVTADFVRRFADLEGIMKIYTDSASFDAVLDSAMRERSGMA